MFSGGKDSTAMLHELIRRDYPIDYIVCADLGAEWPQMYKHISLTQKKINRKIQIVTHPKGDFFYYFKEHILSKGPRKGERGYGWCGKLRWGTGNGSGKKQIIKNFLKSIPGDKIEYHGVAANENDRTNRNKGREIVYPLVDWGMEEQDNLQYCYTKGYSWGGLYHYLDRVSCWCCEMKNNRELRNMYNYFPDIWRKLEKLQTETRYPYKGKGVDFYTRKFAAENKQLKLFTA